MARIFSEGFEFGSIESISWQKTVPEVLLHFSKLASQKIDNNGIYIKQGNVKLHCYLQDLSKPFEWTVEVREG